MNGGTRDGQGPWRPPVIELLPAPGGVYTPVALPEQRPRYGLAALLLGLTFATATLISPVTYMLSRTDVTTDLATWIGPFLTPRVVREVLARPELLKIGLSFSVPALLILLAHELGHYVACRLYGLPSTLPYFLPVPFTFGTFGAFIKIKAPIHSKRQLFDVGVAGPIAGFVALVPFLLYGIARSQPAPLSGRGDLLLPGSCLAIQLATWIFHGRLAHGMVLNLHPTALAAWLGLLATSLNLLPLGQLDGGHILYAASGSFQRRVALPFWAALALLGFRWPGWILWCVIVGVIGPYHPPVYDESIALDPKRRALAWIALLLFLLSFMPVPLRLITLH